VLDGVPEPLAAALRAVAAGPSARRLEQLLDQGENGFLIRGDRRADLDLLRRLLFLVPCSVFPVR